MSAPRSEEDRPARGHRTLRAVLAAMIAAASIAAPPLAQAQEAPPAQAPAAEAAPAEATPPPEEVAPPGTPRAAALGYLEAARDGDYARAAGYLDLRRVPPDERAEVGPELARQLKVVLDRRLWVPVDELSTEPAGDPDDGLAPGVDRVGVIEAPKGDVAVDLERVTRGGETVWLFSDETVARVPRLYEQYGYGPLDRWLPEVFFEFRVLEVLLWQWVALLAVTFAVWLLSYALVSGVVTVLRPVFARTETEIDDRLFESALPPLRLLMAVFLFWAGSQLLGLAVPAQEFLAAACRAFVLVAITWLVLRLVDVVAGIIARNLERRGEEGAVPLVAPGRKAVKGVILLIAFVAVLDNFGFNVTALVAGLGVGGIAVALAAQKSIENLFGGIMLYADRPVRVGDFCKFSDKIGTIEEIGMRSTRVRTLDRTVVTIPNADFSNLQLENYTRRDFIRLHTVIGLRYETTPEQLRHILVEIRNLLYAHPKISNEPARIRFVGFGAYSLDLEIFAYANTPDWNEFLGIREDVFLRIMDLVRASGTGFAFPSSTVYVGKDGGLDAERARAAEAEVAAWRERGELFLPDFSDAKIQELEGEHPWPPPGSPARVHDGGGYPERGGER